VPPVTVRETAPLHLLKHVTLVAELVITISAGWVTVIAAVFEQAGLLLSLTVTWCTPAHKLVAVAVV
jgi:hypothetical protein